MQVSKPKAKCYFDDFIAAAEYLIDQKYTSSDYFGNKKEVANGGSWLALLWPKDQILMKVSLPAVGPFLDMLRLPHLHRWCWMGLWLMDTPEDNEEMFNYLIGLIPQ